jgi:DNA polymerase III alpha subunit (gram-positive type)
MKRLVIDTETTGLSPEIHKTLTVGMLLVDVEHDFLEILDSSHLLIKHDDWIIDPAAIKINKINIEEHTKNAIYPELACKQINNFVERNDLIRTPLLGHNISFDKGFLRELFHQGKSIPKLNNAQIDTMHLWNELKRRGQIPYSLNSKLGTIADYFKIDYEGAHDALADCHITARVYQNLLRIM